MSVDWNKPLMVRDGMSDVVGVYKNNDNTRFVVTRHSGGPRDHSSWTVDKHGKVNFMSEEHPSDIINKPEKRHVNINRDGHWFAYLARDEADESSADRIACVEIDWPGDA